MTAREVVIHADQLAKSAKPLADILYTASSESVEFDLRDFVMSELKVAVAGYDRAQKQLEPGSEVRPRYLCGERQEPPLRTALALAGLSRRTGPAKSS